MIFVDTGAWFAAIVSSDRNHAIASSWLAQNQETLLTTDYVVNETLTLLRGGERRKAIEFGKALFAGELAVLHYMTIADIQETWQVFQHFADKEWSFTDCASKSVMEKLGITQAFAFDHHFRQFGTIQVLPQISE